MKKFTNEELLDELPIGLLESNELTKSQKIVLGQLYIYNGLDIVEKEGYFFRSNRDLCNDCGIKEPTLITAVRKLEFLGFIERKRGYRGTGVTRASLYKVNEDKLKEYSNSNTKNFSNSLSNNTLDIAERIKEIEILLKKSNNDLSNNFSTDIDKDIEIDKDIKILIYNILNNNCNKNILINKLNIILEESLKSKEFESKGTEGQQDESQSALTESQASTSTRPIELEDTQASTEEDSTPMEQQKIPTEDEQYQQWLNELTPYLDELEVVKTLKHYDSVKNKLSQVGREYTETHEEISPTVIERMNKTIGSALREKKSKLLPNVMELSDYLAVMRN